MGAELVSEMTFSSEFPVVERTLSATAEMLSIISVADTLPLGNVCDIRKIVRHLRLPGSFPTQQQTLELRRMLQTMADLKSFFEKYSEDSDAVSAVSALVSVVEPLATFPALVGEIDRVLDRFGNVLDHASVQLSEIRSKLRSMDNTINSAMRRVLARAVSDGVIDREVTPSVRDGRLVIPVSPMYKRKIRGIVHDESSTGKTVFIEPEEVVEANNALRSLQIEEQREIVRILTLLADKLRPYSDEILGAVGIVGEIDFIHAKALYAAEVGGVMPSLDDTPELEWYHACHPVLLASLRRQGKEIVPLDITLSARDRILVISGPNAGGKSVCLKTVGINQYMAQCGVLPVVYDNSHFGIFESIFVDIGDDQSIENDLSTYSSHLANMKTMLRYGNDRSLVLIDEFGSGTEPQIGAAIAQSILGRFNRMKMWGVVTTHYQNLKHFAEENEGLVNGCMLYDRQLMKPLFRLSIGSAGSSFAIEIARKIGLPADIISEAEEIVGSDYVNMDRYLLDIARDKKYWENKRLSIRKKERQLDETISRYEADADMLREKRQDIIAEARTEAKRIVEGTNAAIERTILEIRRSQAEKEATLAARHALTDELKTLTESETQDHELLRKAPRKKKSRKNQPAEPSRQDRRKIEVGVNVRLDGEGQVGTVVSIDGNKATVNFGMLKTTAPVSRLKVTDALVRPASSAGVITVASSDARRDRQLNFRQDIDVRGMRADEAIQAVTYFIDDAIQFNIGRVRILHGTGTGALRQAIRAYLATVPGISSYHDEHVQFGGTGITVVDLK